MWHVQMVARYYAVGDVSRDVSSLSFGERMR